MIDMPNNTEQSFTFAPEGAVASKKEPILRLVPSLISGEWWITLDRGEGDFRLLCGRIPNKEAGLWLLEAATLHALK